MLPLYCRQYVVLRLHWGIFAITQADLPTMRKHFRLLLMVYDPDGKPLYFRYYDPRVLRVYLPSCNTDETQKIFGPIQRFIIEGEDTTTLWKFWLADGQTLNEQVTLSQGENS